MDPNTPIYQGGQSAAGSAMAQLLAVLKGLSVGGVAPGQTMTLGAPFTGTPPTQLGAIPPGLPPTQLGTAPVGLPAPPSVEPSTTMAGPTGTPSFSVPGAADAAMFALRQAANITNPIGGIVHGLRTADDWWNKDAAAAPAPTDPAAADLASTFPTAPYSAPDPTAVDPNADVALSIPFDIDSMPKPPILGEPPKVDMERMQRGTRDRVLGGLASGAASVDATDAGSFARALAAAGGAGASAAGESENKQAEIEYQNALNEYNVSMKNKQSEYEAEGKKWELTQPTMKATNDSIIVQEYDKDAKAYKTRVIKTGGLLADADKFHDFIEATGASGPLAESLQLRLISGTLKNDPVALQGTLKRVAIERTLDNGAGQAVFGDKFIQAQKQAQDKLLASGSVSNDPEKTRTALNREISSILLSDPDLMTTDWLTSASQYGSRAAAMLLEGQQ